MITRRPRALDDMDDTLRVPPPTQTPPRRGTDAPARPRSAAPAAPHWTVTPNPKLWESENGNSFTGVVLVDYVPAVAPAAVTRAQTVSRAEVITSGPAAAAILGVAIAAFVFGLLTVLEHTVTRANDWLSFYAPSGSHSGTLTVSAVAWILAWRLLLRRWEERDVALPRTSLAAIPLFVLGVLGTFPPFYQWVGELAARWLSVLWPLA